MRWATAPFSSKNTSVGVNCTFNAAAKRFSGTLRPSAAVTSRSPQMLIATLMKWRRIFSAMRGSRKFTVTSCLQ